MTRARPRPGPPAPSPLRSGAAESEPRGNHHMKGGKSWTADDGRAAWAASASRWGRRGPLPRGGSADWSASEGTTGCCGPSACARSWRASVATPSTWRRSAWRRPPPAARPPECPAAPMAAHDLVWARQLTRHASEEAAPPPGETLGVAVGARAGPVFRCGRVFFVGIFNHRI